MTRQYTNAITGIGNCLARSDSFRLIFRLAVQRSMKDAVQSIILINCIIPVMTLLLSHPHTDLLSQSSDLQ